MVKTLQQRLVLFLLIPIASILLGVGVMGFLFARNALLDEWKKISILKLERAAHQIDMRLNQPIQLVRIFHQTGDMAEGYLFQKWVVAQLKNLQGVRDVVLEMTTEVGHATGRGFYNQPTGRGRMMNQGRMEPEQWTRMMRFHRAKIVRVTPPRHDVKVGGETVSLISAFKDENDTTVGRLEVSLDFDYLLKDIKAHGWWQSDMAGLVDDAGRFLSHTKAVGQTGRLQLGLGNDPLEKALGIVSIAVILLLIRLVGGKMVGSIREIAEAAEQVAQGNYGSPLAINTKDEIGRLRSQFNDMVTGLKERDFISNTFGRYVDRDIAEKLLKRPEFSRLGGEKRKVVILMSDIRDFTSIAETLSPESVIQMLNSYFSRIIEAIQKQRGIIVDFLGDGVLVFFDPLDGPPEPELKAAVRSALEIQETMVQLNASFASKGLPSLSTGIGINFGEVVVGNIGSESRAKYGIVGTAVNITQRVQSITKGGEVIVSESVYDLIGKDLSIQKSFQTPLKGVQNEMKLFVVTQLFSGIQTE